MPVAWGERNTLPSYSGQLRAGWDGEVNVSMRGRPPGSRLLLREPVLIRNYREILNVGLNVVFVFIFFRVSIFLKISHIQE